ncbi:DUF58 domain-containing protein [Aliivibrio salmonicida]|uniref:DUF58 domain-containing protein n=1 Tax=Aliivibrio salmonicida (strain LFI1238) TaxID=316275 RepID=B6ERE7_ALISL|nr:DUF58 domain-containing protein [Aliivibrio salmonicida]AZL86656.1 DUF58 domain-containing protein [Aliivibrio salmonicida]CAQ81280.1 conserved hypothetical protein [Aliivibrio salmonicida LFI1238]
MKKTNTLSLPPHSNGVTLSLNEMVHYKNHSLQWLPPSQSVWSKMNGSHQSRQKGRGMNFSEVRQYQPGDDIRSIDWRVTARTGKTHTKLYSEEREQPTMLFVDVSDTMRFGSQLLFKSVQAAHFASLLSWITLAEKDRVGGIIFDGLSTLDCKPSSRQKVVLQFLQKIIEKHNTSTSSETKNAAEQADSFVKGLQQLHRLCPKGSEIVIISDFYALTGECKAIFSQLSKHNRIQFVMINDPLEQGVTRFNGVEHVSDNKRTAWLDFSSLSTKNALQQQANLHKAYVHNMAMQLGIHLHTLSSGLPLLSQLTSLSDKGAK